MSVVGLYQFYIGVGLDPLLTLLVEEYEKWLNYILGWAAPFIEALTRWLGWNITLHAHWRHIFVLLGLYFFAGASVEREEQRIGRQSAWIFRLSTGLIIAISTSILLGTVPVTSSDIWPNLMLTLIAFCAVATNDLSLRAYRAWRMLPYETMQRLKGQPTSRWHYFRNAAIPITLRTIVGVVFAYLAIHLLRQTIAPGILALISFVLYLALNQIYLGIREVDLLRDGNESWRSAAGRSRGILIGLNMLWVFVVALAILLLSIARELASTH